MTTGDSVSDRRALRRTVPRLLFALALPMLLLTAAACAGSHDVTTMGPLAVTDAWVRVTNATKSGAMYLTLENRDTSVVTIVGAGSTAARAAELHETMQMDNMAHMQHIDSLPIARGATLSMQPGGVHIMLVDLGREMAPGDSVPLVLRLADGRTTNVMAVVRADQP